MTICSEDLREGTGLLEKEGFNSGERAQYRIYFIYPADPSQQVQTSWLIHLVRLIYIWSGKNEEQFLNEILGKLVLKHWTCPEDVTGQS